MRTAPPQRIGYFGKLPSRADFVKLAGDPAVIDMLDRWLAQTMRLLSADARWRINYDAMPPVSFALVGPRRRHAIAGHLLPSHDLSGRRFPFLAARTHVVPDPARFVNDCPLAFASLWTFLEAHCPRVLRDADPAAGLQAIAEASIPLGDAAPSLSQLLAQGTVGSLGAMLDESQVPRMVLALGLLLQPVMRKQPAELHKSLVFPLPDDVNRRYPVAAFWLQLLLPFLRGADFDLAIFVTRQQDRPAMVVGFGGALAETLCALADPVAAAEQQVSLVDNAWVDEQLPTDVDLRSLASYLAQADLPLGLARDMFIKTFIGAAT